MTTELLWEMYEIKNVCLAISELVRADEEYENIFVACNKAYEWLETKEEVDLFCSMLCDKEFVARLKKEEES